MAHLPHAPLGWLLHGLSFSDDTLQATVSEQLVNGPSDVIELLGIQLPPSVPIGTAPESRFFAVTFSEVTSYRVRPELTYAPNPYGEPAENPCHYPRSPYLDEEPTQCVLSLSAPGLMHWCLITEWHLVDVLCRRPPEVTAISAGA